jgi:hypothetical protein
VISVDNRAFSTKYLKAAFEYCDQQHSKVLVLIADQLMVYNKLRISSQSEQVTRLLEQYREQTKSRVMNAGSVLTRTSQRFNICVWQVRVRRGPPCGYAGDGEDIGVWLSICLFRM